MSTPASIIQIQTNCYWCVPLFHYLPASTVQPAQEEGCFDEFQLNPDLFSKLTCQSQFMNCCFSDGEYRADPKPLAEQLVATLQDLIKSQQSAYHAI